MSIEVHVDEEIRALRPDFMLLVVQARGLRGGPSNESTLAQLAEAAATVTGEPGKHPHVLAWREAYQSFGAKPSRTRCSVEALMRRAAQGLPAINAVVDIYNAVSVRHAIPIGGEDLTRYQGKPQLTRAVGDEPFEVMVNGAVEIEHPDPGEVVWRDDLGVTCRRWNWRQCVRTRITEETSDALFVLEGLVPLSVEQLQVAGDDLATRLREHASSDQIEVRLVLP